MDGTPHTEPGPSSRPGRRSLGKGLLWGLLAVALAFLVGFVWQWYVAEGVREELGRTEEALRIERFRVQLAQAAIAAQSGDFESARSGMSDFFTRLQGQRESLPDSLAPTVERALARRDEVITGLSRSNPEYVGVLFDILRRFSPAPANRPGPPAAAPVGSPGGAAGGAGEGAAGADAVDTPAASGTPEETGGPGGPGG